MTQVDHTILRIIYAAIQKHPGRTAYWIGQLLQMPKGHLDTKLLVLENNGYLVSEDPTGGLWPFRQPGDTGKLL